MNIQNAIIEATNILKNEYIRTAQLDSEILMAKVIGRDRKYVILNNNIDRQALQNENEELELELLSEEKMLSELRKALSLDEFRPKALKFDEKVSIIRAEQGKKEENLKNKARQVEAEFYKKVYPLLYELLLDRGGLLLIDKRNVILWDSSVDITDDAIELINRVLSNSIKSN